jgi:hypothetical protein
VIQCIHEYRLKVELTLAPTTSRNCCGNACCRRILLFGSLLASVHNNADRLAKSELSQPVGPGRYISWILSPAGPLYLRAVGLVLSRTHWSSRSCRIAIVLCTDNCSLQNTTKLFRCGRRTQKSCEVDSSCGKRKRREVIF